MRIRNIVAAAVVAIVLASCGGEKQADVIKVGWFGALTGDQAVWGNNEFNTVKMLFEEINAAGGVTVGGKAYTLEAVGYDNKATRRKR